jgi:hypothetical protein
VNFGTPRISYGGYQVGLAFHKAILSSKFESGDVKLSEIQKLTGDTQIIFILLLSLAPGARCHATAWDSGSHGRPR